MKTLSLLGVACVSIALAISPALARKGKVHRHHAATYYSNSYYGAPVYGAPAYRVPVYGAPVVGRLTPDGQPDVGDALAAANTNYDSGYLYYARGNPR